jgi:hypothetical protein
MILHHTKNLFILDADQDQYEFDWFEKIEKKEGDKRKKKKKNEKRMRKRNRKK